MCTFGGSRSSVHRRVNFRSSLGAPEDTQEKKEKEIFEALMTMFIIFLKTNPHVAAPHMILTASATSLASAVPNVVSDTSLTLDDNVVLPCPGLSAFFPESQ